MRIKPTLPWSKFRPMFLGDRWSVCEGKQVQKRSKQTGKIPKQAEIRKSQEEQPEEGQECCGGSTDDLANGNGWKRGCLYTSWGSWGTCVLMRGVRGRWVWSGDQKMRETFEGTRKIHHRKSWGWGRKQRQCPYDNVKKRRQIRSKNDWMFCSIHIGTNSCKLVFKSLFYYSFLQEMASESHKTALAVWRCK